MATYPTVELKLNSVWTDITTYVRYSDMINIQRGLSSESSQIDPCTCSLTLDNRDGRFSPRNPVGAYYGTIGRNTPLRVSIDAGLPYLGITGTSGDRSSTPDAAALDITGDIDVRVEMFLLNWDVTSETEIIGKYLTTGNQRSWLLTLDAGGYLKFYWTADGSTVLSATATTSLATNGRNRMAVRATLDVDNGAAGKTVTFYTADSITDSWTQLGSAVTTATTTSIFSSTATLQIGDISALSLATMTGRVYHARVLNGIAGTEVANPDFTIQTVGASSFVDAAGRTWTQAGSASISNRKVRFVGEVSTWPVGWDISGKDVITRVEASGILRRLSQGSSPLRSSLYREMTNPARSNIIAYWPCEDAVGSQAIASGLSDGTSMSVSGTPTLFSDTTLLGSDALPVMGTGTFSGNVTPYTATNETALRSWVNIPAGGVATQQSLYQFSSTGTARTWELLLETTGGITIRARDVDGTLLLDNAIAFTVNGQLISLLLELTQNGADIDYRVKVEDYTSVLNIDDPVTGTSSTGTVAGATVGRVTRLIVGRSGGLTDVALGHISFADALAAYSNVDNAAVGWRGENPTSRLIRLCEEEDIYFQLISHAISGVNTTTMGKQDVQDLVGLLRECGDTDLGFLHEPREEIGIASRSRISLYNLDPSLELDYAQNELSAPPIPVDDDRYTRNDVTVTREHGSFSRQELLTGGLSTLAPPNGVGRYESSVTVSLGTDDQLGNQAMWRLHAGTADEARHPDISLNLRHTTFTASASMMENALTLDVGDRITISNPPSWLPPDQISQIVIGYSETLGILERNIVLSCVPESVYHVAVLDDTSYGRLDTSGSTLNAGVNSSATSLTVNTTSGAVWVDSATYASDFPFDIRIAGEVMTVTAITGTTSPQTFTVTRSVNGVTKSQASGASVSLDVPIALAL